MLVQMQMHAYYHIRNQVISKSLHLQAHRSNAPNDAHTHSPSGDRFFLSCSTILQSNRSVPPHWQLQFRSTLSKCAHSDELPPSIGGDSTHTHTPTRRRRCAKQRRLVDPEPAVRWPRVAQSHTVFASPTINAAVSQSPLSSSSSASSSSNLSHIRRSQNAATGAYGAHAHVKHIREQSSVVVNGHTHTHVLAWWTIVRCHLFKGHAIIYQ